MIILISGVSGSGKNTVINKILEHNENLKYITSCTTRSIRPNEIDGVHYYFLTEQQFDDKINNDEFAEHVQLHSHRVGVLKNSLLEAEDKLLIKDIDVYGVNNIRNYLKDKPVDIISIFLDVDKDTLKNRLIERGEKDIELRLKRFELENSFKNNYDYVVENIDLTNTVKTIENIIEKHSKK